MKLVILVHLFLLMLTPASPSAWATDPNEDKEYPTISGIDFSRFPKAPDPKAKRAGRVLHVSPKGNDGGDGSEGRPFKGVAAAVGKAAAGDTVLLHAGTHPLDEPLMIETSDLRVAAAPGEAVTIAPANRDLHEGLNVRGDNVILDGFTIDGFTGFGVMFWRTDRTQKNLVCANLVVKGAGDGFRSAYVEHTAKTPHLSGLLLFNVRIEDATVVGFNVGEGPVTDIRLEKVSVRMKGAGSGSSGDDAIAVESGDNIFIDHADVTGAAADGIDLKATRVCVYNSVVHDVARNGVKFWKGGDLVNSLVYNTGADASIVFGPGAYRILHTIVAFHARGGSAYALTCAYDEPKDKTSLTIANSIFYRNAGAVWVSPATDLKIVNSLLTGAGNGCELEAAQKSGDAISVNGDGDWKALEKKGVVAGILPIAKPPQFVDAEKGDFRLKPGSPGIDAGAAGLEKYPPKDRSGAKRIQGGGPDLGPLETGTK